MHICYTNNCFRIIWVIISSPIAISRPTKWRPLSQHSNRAHANRVVLSKRHTKSPFLVSRTLLRTLLRRVRCCTPPLVCALAKGKIISNDSSCREGLAKLKSQEACPPKQIHPNKNVHLNKFFGTIPVGFPTRVTGKKTKVRVNILKRVV